jgi:hypothetical protein
MCHKSIIKSILYNVVVSKLMGRSDDRHMLSVIILRADFRMTFDYGVCTVSLISFLSSF